MRRYIALYQMITGEKFDLEAADLSKPLESRIEHNLKRVW